MKRSALLLVVMVLMLGVVGCGNKDTASEEMNSAEEVNSAEETATGDDEDTSEDIIEEENTESEYTTYEGEEAFPGVYMAQETGSIIILTENYEGFVDWTDTDVIENYRGPIAWEGGKIFLIDKDNKEINYAIYMHSHNADEYSMLIRNDDQSMEIRFKTEYEDIPQDIAEGIRAEGYDKYLENLYIYER